MRWDQLEPNEIYVLDLTQRPDGIRGIRLRAAKEGEHEHTVLRSLPYYGRDLTEWVNSLTLTKNVSLENGMTFVEEAHGGWFTGEEFSFWRLPKAEKEKIPEEDRPWINGKPPLLPVK